MKLTCARPGDMAGLVRMYQSIVRQMNESCICIWDDVYPAICFEGDIAKAWLYLITGENDVPLSAFALYPACDMAASWAQPDARAMYLHYLGVDPAFARRGIASFALSQAMHIARTQGAAYLRLFVVEGNLPAISLYERNGFTRISGVYEEKIDEGYVLREYAYEIAVCPDIPG